MCNKEEYLFWDIKYNIRIYDPSRHVVRIEIDEHGNEIKRDIII